MSSEYNRRDRPVNIVIPDYGVFVFESHHTKNFRMQADVWPFHKFCWVSSGRGLVVVGDERYPIEQGNVLILPKGTRHQFVDSMNEPLTLSMTCFTTSVVDGEPAFNRFFENHQVSDVLVASNAFYQNQIRQLFRAMLREQSEKLPGYAAAISANLISTLVHVLRGCVPLAASQSSRDFAISGIIDYLKSNFDKPVRIDDLAQLCGISRRRFCDLFKERTGSSVVNYVNAKRIAYAQERLRETGHIAYACHEAGFRELGYFYRVFKRYTGVTPKAYLRQVGVISSG